ncbi:MAG: RecX family transcriptional regulator [Oscillospiraceae bacterium]
MKITDISKTKQGRYALFIDDEFLFSIHIDSLVMHNIKVDDEISMEKLEEIKEESDFKLAKEKALTLLCYKEYTSGQLIKKLSQKVDSSIAQKAADRMCELGLINDESYAVRCANTLAICKGYSKKRIKQELFHRGLSKEIVEETYQAIEVDECCSIAKIINKKYLKYLSDAKGLQKTINACIRLGYSYDDIRYVINHLDEYE